MKVEVTFKSGTQVTVDCSEVRTGRSKVTGELTEMKWVTPRNAKRKLHYIDISEAVCVVAIP